MSSTTCTRRAIVTGGAGFLGSHLCERLVSGGAEVVCVDNLVTGRKRNLESLAGHPRFRFVEHDVTFPLGPLGAADLVVHMASPASPASYQALPIETMLVGGYGCKNALDLAAERGARFLLTSTSEVYGDPWEHPQPETYWGNVNPVGPRAVYDESKRYAEALTFAYRRQLGVDTAVARIFNTYGPWMDPCDGRLIPSLVSQALRGDRLTVTGSGRQTRSLCYVDDTVRGLLALAGSSCAGPINIGNPVENSVLEIAKLIEQLTGIEHGEGVESDRGIEFVADAVDDPKRRCPDIERARELLGWEPEVRLDSGLRRTIAWCAAELGLPVDRAGGPVSRWSGE